MNELLASEIKSITIQHMETTLNAVEILANANQAGAEKALALVLVKHFYDPINAKLGEDWHLRARALGTAKWQATRLLASNDIPALVERALVFLMEDAKATGWHNLMEYDTLLELLSSFYDHTDEGSSFFYDLNFISETLMPVAKKLDIPVDMMVSATHQMMKLRRAVPPCRRIISDMQKGIMEPEQAAEEMTNILTQVADPSISGSKFDTIMGVWHAKSFGDLPQQEGHVYIMPGNRTWMVLEINDPVVQRSVEMATKGLITWNLGDLGDLAKDVLKNTRKTNGL